jgi:A/G-specific adenine glycosylase
LNHAALRARLIAWYRRARRDLPWRRTRDPYRVWISETMLQQTRVDTVIPYYERFVARFPDVRALASADLDSVLGAWAGLGYYSRARNLARAAGLVVREHGGELPRDEAALRALPGVGRYTAGAIRSIAYREPAPIVDGNVTRVLARLRGSKAPADTELWRDAEALARGPRPDLANQALMELGALVCTPRAPRCARCPVASACAARASGDPERFPAPRARGAPRAVRALAGVLRSRSGAVLLVRRPARGLLGGLFELPTVDGDDPRALVACVLRRTGVRVRAVESLGAVHHGFTHRALTLGLVRLERSGGRLRSRDSGARWCAPGALDSVPLSTLARKTLALALAQPSASEIWPTSSSTSKGFWRKATRSQSTRSRASASE